MKLIILFGVLVAGSCGQLQDRSFLDLMGANMFPSRFIGHRLSPLILVIQKDALQDQKDRFLGNWIFDPVKHFQVNLWAVYKALGLPTDLINSKCFLDISKIEKSDSVTYHYRSRTEGNLIPDPLLDFDFQLGKKNSTMMLGKQVEHLLLFKNDKLLFHLTIPELGLVRFIYDFEDDFSGFVETVKLPNGIIGKKEFDRAEDVRDWDVKKDVDVEKKADADLDVDEKKIESSDNQKNIR